MQKSSHVTGPCCNVVLETMPVMLYGRSNPASKVCKDDQPLGSWSLLVSDLARPDTTISKRSVQATRVETGRLLAKEHAVEADLVIPVPESGRYHRMF